MFNKERKRTAGLIYYLPAVKGPYGAGVIGDDAMKAIFRWASRAKMTTVQITPHGPTTISNSPYQSTSGFAGNAYLVNPQRLLTDGLISRQIHDREFCLPDSDQVPYGLLFETREKALRKAFEAFVEKGGLVSEEYLDFCRENSDWLEDYALYAAIKEQCNFRPFYQWPVRLRKRDPEALSAFSDAHSADIAFQKFVQFRFWGDVEEMTRYAADLGISVYADLPFYVSVDSADVWTHPELFQCRYDGDDFCVLQEAGTGSDSFHNVLRSWGNPTYNWEAHWENNYDWFCRRIRLIGKYFAGMRFDHVVGLYTYLGIERDAFGNMTGKRYPGGEDFDPPVTAVLSREAAKYGLEIVGEDLGHIGPECHSHMKSLGWYGMRVLQFAFSERNKADNMHLPFNYDAGDVAYIGNHDNPSGLRFLRTCSEISRRALALWTNETQSDAILTRLIFSLYASPAGQVYLAMPDLVKADTDAFHNGWNWKLSGEMLQNEFADLLADLAVYSNRAPGSHCDYLEATYGLLKGAG